MHKLLTIIEYNSFLYMNFNVQSQYMDAAYSFYMTYIWQLQTLIIF